MKAIIIDDEDLGRTMLKVLIQKYCPEIIVAGEASSVKEAKKQIEEHKPSLIFLDIEMPDGSGFDLLKHFPSPFFSVIFITAYDQYAVKAFKYSAIDYLLKPINIEELCDAVKKATKTSYKEETKFALEHLIDSHNNYGISKSNKIALPTLEGLIFIDISEIIRCEADGRYTMCWTNNGKKLHLTRNLKDFEEQLTRFGFCRVHHAHLVNLNHIKNYIKGEGGQITMINGDVITVSKRKKEEFLKSLNKI